MKTITLKYDPDNGYACPDNQCLDWARAQDGEVVIGTETLLYAFRVLHLRKELNLVSMTWFEKHSEYAIYFDKSARAEGTWPFMLPEQWLNELCEWPQPKEVLPML